MNNGELDMEVINEQLKDYGNSPIALYGLGIETEKAINQLKDQFHIVGLLDGFREDGSIFGQPIISLEKVIEEKVKLIIVVARPGSCRAIAQRIGLFCVENNIALFDIRGKDLLCENKVNYELSGLKKITKRQLMDKAMKADVISFDLFDTLVMRKTLFATDVIELIDARLERKGIHIDNFCKRRLQSEKELSKDKAPRLSEIYQYMLGKDADINISSDELALIEYELDKEILTPRKDMVELAKEFLKIGKQVYIVSDTYYSESHIRKILQKCNISDEIRIYASCEYGTGKTQQLFDIFKKEVTENSYLHIGDDLIADVESAERAGIDSYKIYNAVDILETLGYLGFHDYLSTIQMRNKLGLFVSKIFNSPFLFEKEDYKIRIADEQNLGYLAMAPMITDFTLWFRQQVEKKTSVNVWLGARDGYLIKQLYELLCGKDHTVIYFLTSRMSALRAGITSKEDVDYVASMKFSGSLQEQMKKRFGIIVQDENIEQKTLLDYKDVIIDKAKEYRKNYERYIDSLSLNNQDIFFFDFVAKGTSQLYISKLVKNHIKGFYFLQLEKEAMKDKKLDIESFYDSSDLVNSKIYDEYYILETILTSPMPSLDGFDEAGSPIYATETRSEQDIQCFLDVQQGIVDYFKDYLLLSEDLDVQIDKKMDEVFLDLIHKVEIKAERFMELNVEDPFFNRMTEIKVLI